MTSDGRGPVRAGFSLAEANMLEPDEQHYHSTVENAAGVLGISEHLQCWRREDIDVKSIDPFQLIDDPEDEYGERKVESMRASMRHGVAMPAVMVAHRPAHRHEYWLMEGRHRFNAAHREGSPMIKAWVAHVGCCGGPPADIDDEP